MPMKLIDYVIVGVIVLILGGVIVYLHKAKKKGVKCIGCPDGAKCAGNCSGCSGNCQQK